MRVTVGRISQELECVAKRIVSDGHEIGLVGHIGLTTEPLGKYFAGRFGCAMAYMPSAKRKGHKPGLAKLVSSFYPFMPEMALRVLVPVYKTLYCTSERVQPDMYFPESAAAPDGKEILLVDDSAYTGKTFSLWKERLGEIHPGSEVLTFSITATGDFRPDYYCFGNWRPFEWRPIGI